MNTNDKTEKRIDTDYWKMFSGNLVGFFVCMEVPKIIEKDDVSQR